MRVKLKNIADVQSGYSFRSRLDTSEHGGFKVIQMKDLVDNAVDCNNLVKIHLDEVKEHHYVQKGDLIFRSRGLDATAALLNDDVRKAVVAAPLFRIRITNPRKVLPEYLVWYIGQRDAQIYLASRMKGTLQKMISKQALNELQVVVPGIEKQKQIVELAMLASKEQQLLFALAEKRKQFCTEVLWRCANEQK